MTPNPPRSRIGSPATFTLLFGALTLAVVPVMSMQLGPHIGFLPAVLGVVACVDLLSVYLLVHQFRANGDPRILAMSVAYTWSLVVMLGYAGAFPGVIAVPPPLATAPSVAPWLYVLWHGSFPVLLGLAWAPWPRVLTAARLTERRRRTAVLAHAAAALGAGALVTLIVRAGPSLPVIIHGLDTSRMASLTAPVVLPLVLLSALAAGRAMRGRTGPERWTSAAVWVCLFDLLLTYGSRHRFSLGWYTGRSLTLVAASVILAAMLRETTRVRAALVLAVDQQQRVETLQRSTLDNLSEGVVMTGPDGTVLMTNASARQILAHVEPGRPAPPLPLFRRTGESLRPEDRPAAYTCRTGLPVRNLVLALDAPEGRRWLSVNTMPVDIDGERSVVTSFTDVTDRERIVQEREETALELARARDAAVAADQAKSRFLAATSHEIRTPLNGMLGFTGLLQRTELDERQREFVGLAQTCGEQLLALLNDVLDFSKAEAGQLRLDLKEVDVLELVDDALAVVAEPARAKGLAICGIVDADVPRRVHADGMRIRQALLNLLSNAVKFTPQGSVELRVAQVEGRTRFLVRDSGIGVDPSAVAGLFEPFKQASSGIARQYGGTGLGLAITREIAMLHGGTAGAEPRPGAHGSDFWFTAELTSTGEQDRKFLHGLGVRVDEDDAAQRERIEALVARAGGRPGDELVVRLDRGDDQAGLVIPIGTTCRQVLHLLERSPAAPAPTVAAVLLSGRVLIAEDNAVNQRIATLILEAMGLSVDVVSSGRAAVDAALTQSYDAILMDCQMPEMDGITATRLLRDRGCQTPILALTAAASRQNEVSCREAGMDDYLTKPIDVDGLAAALQRHLLKASDGSARVRSAVSG